MFHPTHAAALAGVFLLACTSGGSDGTLPSDAAIASDAMRAADASRATDAQPAETASGDVAIPFHDGDITMDTGASDEASPPAPIRVLTAEYFQGYGGYGGTAA